MKKFLDKHFLLDGTAAQHFYHTYAEEMPIIDYHCHLPPDQIANDINFENLTQIWLYGDHYKWRAMRANGVDESFITGSKSDVEKFQKWAETVPYTLRNPLYHWTHLELKRYFDIDELLGPATAKKIYHECSEKLRTKEYSVRSLMRKMNVKVVCTTDDPTDLLEHHRNINAEGFEIRVIPAFRPDKAMNVDDVKTFNQYLSKLESVADASITKLSNIPGCLKKAS
jgi:glucuronate isomerase